MRVTDQQIRDYRHTLFGHRFVYDRWLTCQIALGNREPSERITRAQARALVAKWIAEAP